MRMRKRDSGQIIAIVLLSIISQITVLTRSSVIAGIFGASLEMDAYNLASSIISFVFGLVTSGITTIVLPEYVKDTKNKNISAFISFIYSIVLLLIAVLFILRFQILSLASNKGELFISLASSIMGVLLIANGISSVSSIAIAYSQSKGKFVIPKIFNLLGQIIILLTVFVLRNKMGIYTYALAVTGGLLVDAIINICFSVRTGWRINLSVHIWNEETKTLILRFVPLMLSAGVYQLSLFVDSIIAANLEVGKITILSYSAQIIGMINAVFIANLTIYFYPRIIRCISDTDGQAYFWKLTGLLHLLTCLLICGFFTVGNEGIAFIFEHGSFDSQTSYLVFLGSCIYMVGQQTNIIRELIYRYFYANGNTKSPGENSVIVSVLNIIISITLVKFIGFYGIIIGTVCASLISLIGIMIRFHHFYSFYEPVEKIIIMFFRNIVTAGLSVLCVIFLKRHLFFSSHLVTIVFYGIVTVIIFAFFSLLLSRDLLAVYKGKKS